MKPRNFSKKSTSSW